MDKDKTFLAYIQDVASGRELVFPCSSKELAARLASDLGDVQAHVQHYAPKIFEAVFTQGWRTGRRI
jgi:hypothetical protein